jgi:hypothetical protein
MKRNPARAGHASSRQREQDRRICYTSGGSF